MVSSPASQPASQPASNDGAGYDNQRRPLSPGERMVNANHATYLVVGRAKLWIPNRDEFEALGYDWSKVDSLSRAALQQFEGVPIDGTLVKERSDSHTFVISGRHRWWVQDREQFDKNHFDWKNVHISLSPISAARSAGENKPDRSH